MQTRVMTAHVPLPLAAKVDALAARLDRSRGWTIKQALADWIADEEARHQLTLAGLAAIDAGRVEVLDETIAIARVAHARQGR